MPTASTQASAAELQRHLAEITGHSHARVRPYGKHLLIQMHHDDVADTVARLTEVGLSTYTAAFRSHTGRWEPLPIPPADLQRTATAVATLLAPYLQP